MSDADDISIRIVKLLDELFSQGVKFKVEKTRLRVHDPYSTITPRQEHMLRKHKWAIMFTLHMWQENLKEEESANASC